MAYLASDAARRSVEVDPYWPKWHSPWWHMVLLHELGEARQIPAPIAAAMVAGIDRLLHVFPIDPADAAGRNHTTILPTADRSPSPRAPASSFPLLDAVSAIDVPSEALTRQWSEAREGLLRLAEAGQLSAPPSP